MKIVLVLLLVTVSCAFFPYAGTAAEKASMVIRLGGKAYTVDLESNITIQDILGKMPLSLPMQRYAGHEYYAELPFRPEFAQERTSHIQAGHLYYWDGWNAFVINYEESDITPYKVVHLGRVNDAEGICAALREADDKINVNIEHK